VKGNAVVNWIFFIIDGLGSIFGSVMAYWLVCVTQSTAMIANGIMKKKSILKFLATDIDRTIKFQDIDNLSSDEIKDLFLPTNVGKK